MFCFSQSAGEAANIGLSSSRGFGPRMSRDDVLQWRGSSGELPQSIQGERVYFVPFLLRGVGFPIHPFLRGLLEYYGLQLHSLTPASILILRVTSLYASYSWAARPISIYGGDCSSIYGAIYIMMYGVIAVSYLKYLYLETGPTGG